ncbi:MAG: hypothetical protein OHK93_008755 [Ramalina farinacea]|uniref:Protection of telomeres protein 1 n=1 Tax=Ramalina farinacea TaxID=258253 RepID=A0AA43QQW7_9LECA|nr:hypothetical protein [Ramalina farinacea]
MEVTIPPRMTDLWTASTSNNYSFINNVMGIVTDALAAFKTRGDDWCCTFSLVDGKLGSFGSTGEGLKVRYFRKTPDELPPVHNKGDIVILRSIKLNQYNGMNIIISTRTSGWTVIPAATIPKSPSKAIPLNYPLMKSYGTIEPITAELAYAVGLANSRDSSLVGPMVPPPNLAASSPAPANGTNVMVGNTTRKDKFSLVKDLRIDTFYDIVGQVAKLYPDNDRSELYLSDYTSSGLLWNYIDPKQQGENEGDRWVPEVQENRDWPGPWGKMTLSVTLWSPHSYFANSNVKVGGFVHLRNVHVKWSKDGKMEGVLHTDRRNPDRIDVTIIKNHENDDQVKDVLRRKRDYWNKYKSKLPSGYETISKGEKRKADDNDGRTLTKKQKKQRKNAREKQEKQTSAAGESDSRADQHGQTNGYHRRTEPPALPTKPGISNPLSKKDINPNVHCAHHTIPTRPLSDIKSFSHHQNTTPKGTTYTLPFQNIKSRLSARIIDFYPPNLEDFSVRLPKGPNAEYACLSDNESPGLGPSTSSPSPSSSEDEANQPDSSLTQSTRRSSSTTKKSKWEWRFSLTLIDSSHPPKTPLKPDDMIQVFITGQDAEHLLKLDATDLRKDSETLAALREKLFLLWGDLEERKCADANPGALVDADRHTPTRKDMPKGTRGSKAFECCVKEYGIKVRKKSAPPPPPPGTNS